MHAHDEYNYRQHTVEPSCRVQFGWKTPDPTNPNLALTFPRCLILKKACIQKWLNGSQKVSCLCLLDLSADTTDHDIFITRLSSWFGIHGSVLRWFKSYPYVTGLLFWLRVLVVCRRLPLKRLHTTKTLSQNNKPGTYNERSHPSVPMSPPEI